MRSKYMKINNPFIATRKLISSENKGYDGKVTYPYGDNPIGYLIYNADGYMAVQIMNRDRCQSNPDFPLEAAFRQTLPDEDRLMANNTYHVYYGYWERAIDHA